MLENKRSALRDVTLETSSVLTEQLGPAANNFLRKTRPAAFNRAPRVWIVTIRAAHLAFQNRMVMRQFKFRANFQVALKTRIGRSTRIDDLAFLAATLHVETSGPVTRFAAHLFRVFARSFQTRVRRRSEIARDIFVASRAFI